MSSTLQTFQTEIGKRLYNTRKKLGLSGKDMGKALGLSAQAVSNMELGKTAVSVEHVVFFRQKWRVNPLYLIFGENPIFEKTNSAETERLENIETFLKEKYGFEKA